MGMRQGPPQEEQQPAQQQPQQTPEGPQQDQMGKVTELFVSTGKGLEQLLDIISKSPLEDQEKQQFQQIVASFQEFASSMGDQQEEGEPEQEAPEQNVPQETAGRPAQPMM